MLRDYSFLNTKAVIGANEWQLASSHKLSLDRAGLYLKLTTNISTIYFVLSADCHLVSELHP